MVEDDSIYEPSGSEAFESRPIGEYLRRQRILRGMSAEELAELTRIPLRSLERLENGQFDGETDGFVRGLVRTAAVALGLDTDDTVARMLQEPEASAWQRHGPGRSAKQAFAATIFLLLLGCGVLGVRAVWGLLLGDASRPASRQVIVWTDPVHSLAAASGEAVDGNPEIEPRPGPGDVELRAGAPPEAVKSGAADTDQSWFQGQNERPNGRVGEADDLVLAP